MKVPVRPRLAGLLRAWLMLAMVVTTAAWLPQAARAESSMPGLVDLQFDDAEFVTSADVLPPADGWTRHALPHNWARSLPGFEGFGWYRLRFVLETLPTDALAVYVPRVAATGQFRLNGSLLNPQVRFGQPGGLAATAMATQPQYLVLPAGLFRVGENMLHIRVQGAALRHSGLSTVHIGKPDLLRKAWLVREIPQQRIPQALLVLLLSTLVFSLALWWRERQLRHRQFVVVVALWALVLWIYLEANPPFSDLGAALFATLLMIAFNWALLDLCYRFSASTWRWFIPVLNVSAAAMVLATVLIVLFGRELVHLRWVLAPVLPLRLVATLMLAHWAWRERSLRALALSGAEALWFIGFLQFAAVAWGLLPNWPFLLSPADGLLLFVVLLFFFVERLIVDRQTTARAQMAAVAAERQRILLDMHDGMGSQLIIASRLLQRPQVDRALVARNIDEALQDMRLIIDSLDMADRDLLPLLGNLRFRLQPRLASLGIRLEWEVQPAPAGFGLSQRSALNVLRIVQEAVNNVVRHARAQRIVITVRPHDGGVRITVADDGCGFDVDAAGAAGRGLQGMRQRAADLGAQWGLESRDGQGTVVSLWLPASESADPARPADAAL